MPKWSQAQEQTLFTLAMLPSLGSCYEGDVPTIEQELAKRLDSVLLALQGEIGEWKVIWGPAVFELPRSTRPDNTMFVAQRHGGDHGLPDLVVAIAGTNPYSFLDWLVEDFFVTPQVPWLTGHPTGSPMISLGTFIGLSALQNLRPSPGLPGEYLTVREFLALHALLLPVTINVCGHSLGGALSPTLALWLHDTQAFWNHFGHASLSVLAAAGPTAGNQAFAAYSNAQIGSQITRIYNPLDIVPHAWATADLLAIPQLYAPLIQPDLFVEALIALAVVISAGGGYTQIATAQGLPTEPPNPAILDFLLQGAYQHVDAYFKLLGIPARRKIIECVKATASQLGPVDRTARVKSNIAKHRLGAGLSAG
jgi:hypothetical protein